MCTFDMAHYIATTRSGALLPLQLKNASLVPARKPPMPASAWRDTAKPPSGGRGVRARRGVPAASRRDAKGFQRCQYSSGGGPQSVGMQE